MRDRNFGYRFGEISRREAEDPDQPGSYVISFASEEPCSRWWGVEILDNSEAAVDMTRLSDIGVVLFNHNRNDVLGKVLRAWTDGGRSYAEIQFDEDEDAAKIRAKVDSGTLKGVSVGYTVDSWEVVEVGKKSMDERFTGPCEIARRWTPYEVSIVSIPADSTVGVGREMEELTAVPDTSDGFAGYESRYRQWQYNASMAGI